MDKLTRKAAMQEIRESEWFNAATESGSQPIIRVSPHNTRGLGN